MAKKQRSSYAVTEESPEVTAFVHFNFSDGSRRSFPLRDVKAEIELGTNGIITFKDYKGDIVNVVSSNVLTYRVLPARNAAKTEVDDAFSTTSFEGLE